jgi:hypothetical protein
LIYKVTISFCLFEYPHSSVPMLVLLSFCVCGSMPVLLCFELIKPLI